MADETTVKFMYPPNFVGTYNEGDKGIRRVIVKCTNISDGTGEDDAIKIKRTDMKNSDGDIPKKLIIEKIDYDVSGMTVYVEYNNANSDRVAVLTDSAGCMDFNSIGGYAPTYETADGENDVGDIVLTTDGESLGDSYDITLTVKLSGK